MSQEVSKDVFLGLCPEKPLDDRTFVAYQCYYPRISTIIGCCKQASEIRGPAKNRGNEVSQPERLLRLTLIFFLTTVRLFVIRVYTVRAGAADSWKRAR